MNLETITQKINTSPAVLLYFSGESCGVCQVLKPKIFEAIETNYPKIEVIEISVDEYKLIAATFEAFALPTIILYLDGKEFIKKSRNVSVNGLMQEIQRPYNLFFGE